MLASVLKSDIAIDTSIRITNTFIAMRKALSSITPLMARIVETERLQLEEKTARLTDQARNEERFRRLKRGSGRRPRMEAHCVYAVLLLDANLPPPFGGRHRRITRKRKLAVVNVAANPQRNAVKEKALATPLDRAESYMHFAPVNVGGKR